MSSYLKLGTRGDMEVLTIACASPRNSRQNAGHCPGGSVDFDYHPNGY